MVLYLVKLPSDNQGMEVFYHRHIPHVSGSLEISPTGQRGIEHAAVGQRLESLPYNYCWNLLQANRRTLISSPHQILSGFPFYWVKSLLWLDSTRLLLSKWNVSNYTWLYHISFFQMIIKTDIKVKILRKTKTYLRKLSKTLVSSQALSQSK